MTENSKKTRNCIEPWRSFQFEAGGGIGPCCSGTIVGNFGNIITSSFQKQIDKELEDIFAPDLKFISHITIARPKFVEDKKTLINEINKNSAVVGSLIEIFQNLKDINEIL